MGQRALQRRTSSSAIAGLVKVLDLGLAKVFDRWTLDEAEAATVTGVTRVGVVLGTAGSYGNRRRGFSGSPGANGRLRA